jgi:hypothetical protein
VPLTSVSTPPPSGISLDLLTEPEGVLSKRVSARGLCRPGAVSVVRVALAVDDIEDPWFPVDAEGKTIESGDRAIQAARLACLGCPVIAECRVLAHREEARTGDIHGVRGGLSAGERRAAYRAAATKGGDAQ